MVLQGQEGMLYQYRQHLQNLNAYSFILFKISKTIHNFPSTKTQEERKEDLENLLKDEYGDGDDQNIIKTRKRPQPGCNKQPNESRDGDHPGSSSVPNIKKKAPKLKKTRKSVFELYRI